TGPAAACKAAPRLAAQPDVVVPRFALAGRCRRLSRRMAGHDGRQSHAVTRTERCFHRLGRDEVTRIRAEVLDVELPLARPLPGQVQLADAALLAAPQGIFPDDFQDDLAAGGAAQGDGELVVRRELDG